MEAYISSTLAIFEPWREVREVAEAMVTDSVGLAAEGRGRYRLMSIKNPGVPADVSSVSFDYICSAALCLPVHPPDLGPRASSAGGNLAGAGSAHGGRGPAGDGPERGAALRALSPGLESGALVVAAGGADSAGTVAANAAAILASCGGGRRDAGAAQRRADSGEGDVSRCGALESEQGGDLLGVGVDLHGAAGACSLERAPLGTALSHPLGAFEAGQRGGRTAPPHRRRAHHRHGVASGALAEAAPLGADR
jgi:hypothetical protein